MRPKTAQQVLRDAQARLKAAELAYEAHRDDLMAHGCWGEVLAAYREVTHAEAFTRRN